MSDSPLPSSPRLRELVTLLRSHREAVRSAVHAVPAAWHHASPTADGWSVAQVLQHLALVESSSGRLFTKTFRAARDAGLARETETASLAHALDHTGLAVPDTKVRAPELVAPPASVTMDEAFAALDASRARLLEAVQEADGYALGEPRARHPVLGELSLYQWLLAIALHDARHRVQLEAMRAIAPA